MKGWACVLTSVASLFRGCAVPAVGRPLPPSEVRAIERRVTTADQVRERFGEPSRVTPGAADHLGRLTARQICDSVGLVRSLALLFISCSPTRLEQELWLVVDERVVATYTYESRDVPLEAYRR